MGRGFQHRDARAFRIGDRGPRAALHLLAVIVQGTFAPGSQMEEQAVDPLAASDCSCALTHHRTTRSANAASAVVVAKATTAIHPN